jgi:hypothetical protein
MLLSKIITKNDSLNKVADPWCTQTCSIWFHICAISSQQGFGNMIEN